MSRLELPADPARLLLAAVLLVLVAEPGSAAGDGGATAGIRRRPVGRRSAGGRNRHVRPPRAC